MTISRYDYFAYGADGCMKPIIFCDANEEITKNAVSLNVKMAERLKGIKPEQRFIRLSSVFDEIIRNFPEDSVIKDFELLFNPEYKIDVLSFLVAAYKKRRFAVIWPGKYVDGKLTYAEPGYLEFKRYDLSAYDVTCVIA